MSTNAYLVYGYYLGDPNEEWELEDPPEWMTTDEDVDIVDEIESRLSAAAGETAVEKRFGVTLEVSCSGEYPLYLLAARVIAAHRGDVITVEPADLADGQVEYDRKLKDATTVLELKPIQQRPCWMLVSYWG